MWACLHLDVDLHPSDSEFDPYNDCLTNISQDVIDKVMMCYTLTYTVLSMGRVLCGASHRVITGSGVEGWR